MDIRNQSWLVHLIWALLVLALVVSLASARWSLSFVVISTLVLTLAPSLFVERFQIKLPQSFVAFIVTIIFAAIFLGEAFDFYERYWWWDIALHGASAVGFGLVGFLFVFMPFEGDRYAAPPFSLSFVAFCIGVMIGSAWEVFEFSMDQLFGMNMQKSGLLDTMGDLIVNMIGSFLGALAGYLFLKKRRFAGLVYLIRDFVRTNRDFYRKTDNDD